MIDLDQYERSYCDCAACREACKHMPGSLAPGDFENIARETGSQSDDKFLENYFIASDGPLVRVFEEGVPRDFHIPTIVPAQDASGRCVFLSDDERCTIHRSAPFGCRNYSVCEDKPDYDMRSADMLKACMMDHEYGQMHEHLVSKGLIATPLTQRRKNLQTALNEMESDNH